jgi:heparosan-N-sulfate-glucuronate 5-epimerase
VNETATRSNVGDKLRMVRRKMRLESGSPNTFGSETSFDPPIGHHWAPGEPPRGYYIDFRMKNTTPAWPPFWLEDRVKQFAVTNAQWGLGAIERFLDGEGDEWLQGAKDCADHVIAGLQVGGPHDGAWMHLESMPHTFPLDPPWISAMGQGECASLLTRVHLLTGEDAYAEAALRTTKTLLMPTADGGTLAEVDGQPVLEEYPTAKPSAVLNGAIFAMWGLYDVGVGLGGAESMRLFEATTDGLARLMHRYDCGYWSVYDLYPNPLKHVASPAYHLLHVKQLRVLDQLSHRPQLSAAVDAFERYRGSRLCRSRAIAAAIAFRLAVPRNPVLAHRLPWSHSA